MVAWLGYQPPSGVGLDAARSEVAADGARALLRFLAELPGEATVTVIGHSYGSLVWAYAAPDLPPRVTDLVAIGSPGLDVSRATRLRTTARIWAGRAADDWIRWVPSVRVFGVGHGADPVAPGFGALALNVSGAAGHDGYFQPSTRSLASLAAVASGSDRARGAR
ncbi:MAG: alpha/beta fold hydrolase [Micromonosporaceae bacterium]